MDRDDSVIYIGFSFHLKLPYYGLVEDHAPHKRWVEHWRSIRQHQTGLHMMREEKYAYNHGSEWRSQSMVLLTLILCGRQIELSLEATSS